MITANMHYIKTVRASANGSTAWLDLIAEDRSVFAVFMPYAVAQAMADAYAAATADPVAS